MCENSKTGSARAGGYWSPAISLAVDEIGELPAPVYSPDAGAITIVAKRFLGELRWRDHIAFILHEFFRQNSLELRPEALLLPVLKNARAIRSRLQPFQSGFYFVSKIVRHHRLERRNVAGR